MHTAAYVAATAALLALAPAPRLLPSLRVAAAPNLPVETAVAGADEDRASSSRTAREWGVTHDGAMGWVRRERDASADAASLAMRLSILGIGTLRWESRRRFLASRRVLLASTRSPARPRSLGRAR